MSKHQLKEDAQLLKFKRKTFYLFVFSSIFFNFIIIFTPNPYSRSVSFFLLIYNLFFFNYFFATLSS